MELMSGNEAIPQGAWEAGCTIGVAYPGTPSTETLEAFAKKEGVYAEWCVNEKVAVEVGIGASAAGARVLATMKHVGVNVAADPLFTVAYTGVGGGILTGGRLLEGAASSYWPPTIRACTRPKTSRIPAITPKPRPSRASIRPTPPRLCASPARPTISPSASTCR